MSWLVTSIGLSVVLTVLLNAGLRLFRGNGRRNTPAATEPRWSAPEWSGAHESRTSDRQVRVWAPWKAMIVGSLVLTILLNLVLRIA